MYSILRYEGGAVAIFIQIINPAEGDDGEERATGYFMLYEMRIASHTSSSVHIKCPQIIVELDEEYVVQNICGLDNKFAFQDGRLYGIRSNPWRL
jgi:hypothetical protein